MYLLARNEEINRWLEENPAVLGGGAIALGFVLLVLGIASLRSGQATGKRGRKYEGGSAYVYGAVRAIAGGVCLLFGIYKLVSSFR